MIQRLALVCVALLLWGSLADAALPQTSLVDRQADIKERLTLMLSGSIVEVRLMNNQKVRGRLGSISDSSFEIQQTTKGQVVSATVGYANVKSVKVIERGVVG